MGELLGLLAIRLRMFRHAAREFLSGWLGATVDR